MKWASDRGFDGGWGFRETVSVVGGASERGLIGGWEFREGFRWWVEIQRGVSMVGGISNRLQWRVGLPERGFKERAGLQRENGFD